VTLHDLGQIFVALECRLLLTHVRLPTSRAVLRHVISDQAKQRTVMSRHASSRSQDTQRYLMSILLFLSAS
jgi:hypothetical protein